MFTEKQLERYADVLLWGLKTARTGKIRRGEIIQIRYDVAAIRLAEILYGRLMERGMHVVQRMNSTSVMEEQFYSAANNRQLVFKFPGDEELCRNLNGSIHLIAPASLTHLADIDPKKIGTAAVARKHLKDILDKREERGEFSWTLCVCPTEALARHAGLSPEDYGRQIVKACFLNRRDPLAEWRRIFKQTQSIKKWLNSMSVAWLHVESDRIDLKITPGKQRKWVGVSGHNIPSFEIFISPDWRGTEGVFYADQPSFRSGNRVEGVRLEFRKGAAVKVTADKGEAFTIKQLAMDKGANKVGEFSLTDKRFSRIDAFMANTLFDENFGGKFGNCHVAVGSSYSDAYDGNPEELTKGLKKKLGVQGSGFGVKRFGVKGRVQGFRFWVQGSRFRGSGVLGFCPSIVNRHSIIRHSIIRQSSFAFDLWF